MEGNVIDPRLERPADFMAFERGARIDKVGVRVAGSLHGWFWFSPFLSKETLYSKN